MGAPMMLAGSHSSRYHRFQMYFCVLFVCEFASIVVVASLISRLWLHYFYNLSLIFSIDSGVTFIMKTLKLFLLLLLLRNFG